MAVSRGLFYVKYLWNVCFSREVRKSVYASLLNDRVKSMIHGERKN